MDRGKRKFDSAFEDLISGEPLFLIKWCAMNEESLQSIIRL